MQPEVAKTGSGRVEELVATKLTLSGVISSEVA